MKKQEKIQGIVLGCTDLPILLNQKDVNIPVFDTVEVLAEAAIKKAVK